MGWRAARGGSEDQDDERFRAGTAGRTRAFAANAMDSDSKHRHSPPPLTIR
jgi:hypothetical protein